jgi:glycosyltransferase involved in cell wall biosynthesis
MKLSVIIASYNSRQTIARCLQSLVSQRRDGEVEVIVVDSSQDGTAEIVAQQFPEVRLYTFAERKFPGDARNIGLSHAAGDILAFTDADCVVDENWVREILKAHQSPVPIIGGVIDNGNPESYVGWSHYFSNFSLWMPGTPAGPMVEIPTVCLSMKRWAFDRCGPFLERTYSSDTVFHWRAAKGELKPRLVPSIRVSHTNITSWRGVLKRNLIRGRYFAAVRMREHHFSTLRRAVFVVGAPWLPFLLFYRTARRVLKSGVYVNQFVLSSPLILLGLAAWSLGEFWGYLSNPSR